MKRIEFEMDEEHWAKINSLAKEGGVTLREFLNQSITLLEGVMDLAKQGRILASIDENTNMWREIQMPCTTTIRAKRG